MGESWAAQPTEPLADPLEPTDPLSDISSAIEWPDLQAEAAARTWRATSGDVDGQLADLVEWLSGVQGCFPPHDVHRARLVIFAADHGVAEAGVSARAAGSTNVQAADVAAGADPYGDLAEFTGAGVRVVDVGLLEPVAGVDTRVARRGTGRIDRENALSIEAAEAAIWAGASVADAEIDCGADLLLCAAIGVGGSTAAAALISVVTGVEPAKVVGRGSGINDDAWMRKVAAVRDARWRGRAYRQDQRSLLAACGGSELAALTGFLLRAASRRTPVVIDGVVTLAAALVAH